ncbi:MAG: aldehyde dehydrogenase family protein [Oscillospiraceae bacterium]|nr:aldehyde dehydrogenase family protein [Oscillospiraceae bacterium]
MNTDFSPILKKQRELFNTNETKDIEFRINSLKKLKQVINKKQAEITKTCMNVLERPEFEVYFSEIIQPIDEINHAIKKLKSWSRPKRAKTPLIHFKSNSKIYSEPYGIALIISTWNFPFNLTIIPVISAIAAGNCCIIKTSELAPNVAKLIDEIIKESFDEKHCTVIQGGIEESTSLLKEKFDIIFFTGSSNIGKIIAQAAAINLTPTILELGGKNPCIIDKLDEDNLKTAVRRIAWGKFMNAGQVCIAPDHIFVQKDIKDDFIKLMRKQIEEFYGTAPLESKDLCKVINKNHFDRLVSYLQKEQICIGGNYNSTTLKIEPTILTNVSIDSPVMKSEIFGPILPIFEFESIDEAINTIKKFEKPLALYFYSKNKDKVKKIINEIPSGDACINATILHCFSYYLPFGGVGNSGMGSYHGKWGFDAFSHRKSVLNKSLAVDFKLAYPPYKDKVKLFKKLYGYNKRTP